MGDGPLPKEQVLNRRVCAHFWLFLRTPAEKKWIRSEISLGRKNEGPNEEVDRMQPEKKRERQIVRSFL